jgi:Uma2 family endonuclease
MEAPLARRRFLVDDYERMVAAGILTEDDRVELISGEIVEMAPIGGRHMGRVNVLNDLLTELVRQKALVSVQNPIRLSDDSEPQPDIVLLRRSASRDVVPTPADVLLVIEVADSSRDYDRGVKLPMYAGAGIPETWLVDLVGEIVERHSDPDDGIYRRLAPFRRGESITSTVLPDLVLSVEAIFG